MDRLSFSVIWELTPQGEIVDQWFGRTAMCSCAKLAYEHAQQMIEGTFAPSEELGVELHGHHTWDQVGALAQFTRHWLMCPATRVIPSL